MQKIFQAIFTVYSLLIFSILMLILGPFILIPVLLSDKAGTVSFFFIRLWARTWSFLSGFRFEIYGRENIELQKPYIYIFNHCSFFDAPTIPVAIPQQVRALGKKELKNIPVFGFLISRLAVWVDRDNPESRKESLAKLVQILEKRISIVVSPEGTRNDSEKILLPFNKGVFRLSIETGIPIYPIAIIGAAQIHQRGSYLLSPGKVRIYFLSPIDPPDPNSQQVEAFIKKCRTELEKFIEEKTTTG